MNSSGTKKTFLVQNSEVVICERYKNANEVCFYMDGLEFTFKVVDRKRGILQNVQTGKRFCASSLAKEITSLSESKIRAHKNEISSSAQIVRSPMPGKISKLYVKLGDRVFKGQTLACVEAMKMEYALKSPIEGIVQNLKFFENDQVSESDMLLEVMHEQLT